MAAMLVLTTTSFTVAAHFCGDQLIDLAINSEASSCSMQVLDKDMQDLMQDMGCCDDHEIASTVDDDLLKSPSSLKMIGKTFYLSPIISFKNKPSLSIDDEHKPSSSKGSPPLIYRAPLFILHDSFLI